jgi:3-hydroxyacyl-[acyl-carrier-protein] dehydratase
LNPKEVDIYSILDLLPHRYPMLLIDRVVEFKPDDSITAIKNVTVNEPFFQGHFPGRPIMPGVLILEAMAQAAALLFRVDEENQPGEGAVYYFVGIDDARFKRPVEPGDQLFLHISIKRKMRGIWKFVAEGKVDGQTCCTAELMCTYKEQ